MIQDSNKISKIKKDYMAGKTYKQIAEKHDVTYNEVLYLAKKKKWQRESNLSKVKKGNKNAVGNKGGHGTEGNKNAVVTGEYENIYKDVLDPEELEAYNTIHINDKAEALLNEYRILTIRETRMLTRIKELKQQGKDMTIDFIRKKNSKSETETITEAEPTLNIIQRIEDGLTRVQEAKRKCIESLIKIDANNDDKPLNVNITNNSLLESINRQLGGGGHE